MINLKSDFAAVYVLTEDGNHAKQAIIAEELKNLEVKFEFISRIPNTSCPYTLTRHMQDDGSGITKSSATALLLSHFKAIKQAKEQGLTSVVILNDDFIFKHDVDVTVPVEYDILFIGEVPSAAYVVHSKFYDRFIAAITENLSRQIWKSDPTSGILDIANLLQSLQLRYKVLTLALPIVEVWDKVFATPRPSLLE